jgi:hypothetical protein
MTKFIQRLKNDLENEILRRPGEPIISTEDIERLLTEHQRYYHALNKISMAQSGPMDYTQDFFEFVKQTTRQALKEEV